MTRKIQCMEYYPELYVSDDGTVPSIDYTNHGASDIQSVGLVSDVYGANGIMYSRIGVTWQLPRDGKVSNVVVNYRNVKKRYVDIYWKTTQHPQTLPRYLMCY